MQISTTILARAQAASRDRIIVKTRTHLLPAELAVTDDVADERAVRLTGVDGTRVGIHPQSRGNGPPNPR